MTEIRETREDSAEFTRTAVPQEIAERGSTPREKNKERKGEDY